LAASQLTLLGTWPFVRSSEGGAAVLMEYVSRRRLIAQEIGRSQPILEYFARLGRGHPAGAALSVLKNG
jgi:hypothetical protein